MLQSQGRDLQAKVQCNGPGWEAVLLVDPVNERVKLKRYQFEHEEGLADLGEYLLSLARKEGFGKVLAEVREQDWEQFLGRGFSPEGIIPGYYQGDPAYTLSYFTDPQRQSSSQLEHENAVLERVLTAPEGAAPAVKEGYTLEEATPQDAREMAAVFARVFTSYPTPLTDPLYLTELMETEEGLFRLVRQSGRLVSAAAAEVDWVNRNAEMTNCATLPEYRGEGLMAAMLADLEREMSRREVPCLFSIARATSTGMNLVLRRLGYQYRGRLINNCHIMGGFEDMNIWVKQL